MPDPLGWKVNRKYKIENKVMKTMQYSQSASNFLSRVKSKYALNALALSLLWGFTTIGHAQGANDGTAPTTANTAVSADSTGPAGDATNTPVQQIQVSLDKIKIEIVTAATEMAKANASTPAQQMEK